MNKNFYPSRFNSNKEKRKIDYKPHTDVDFQMLEKENNTLLWLIIERLKNICEKSTS